MNELKFSAIRKIFMCTILIDEICNLVINVLADVAGFKWCINFVVSRASHSNSISEKGSIHYDYPILSAGSSGYRLIDAMLFWELKIGCKKDCFRNAPFSIAN